MHSEQKKNREAELLLTLVYAVEGPKTKAVPEVTKVGDNYNVKFTPKEAGEWKAPHGFGLTSPADSPSPPSRSPLPSMVSTFPARSSPSLSWTPSRSVVRARSVCTIRQPTSQVRVPRIPNRIFHRRVLPDKARADVANLQKLLEVKEIHKRPDFEPWIPVDLMVREQNTKTKRPQKAVSLTHCCVQDKPDREAVFKKAGTRNLPVCTHLFGSL